MFSAESEIDSLEKSVSRGGGGLLDPSLLPDEYAESLVRRVNRVSSLTVFAVSSVDFGPNGLSLDEGSLSAPVEGDLIIGLISPEADVEPLMRPVDESSSVRVFSSVVNIEGPCFSDVPDSLLPDFGSLIVMLPCNDAYIELLLGRPGLYDC